MSAKIIVVGDGVVSQVLCSHLCRERGVAKSEIFKVPVIRSGSQYTASDIEVLEILNTQKKSNLLTYLAIGYWQNNRAREEFARKLESQGVRFDSFISSDALISEETRIESNVLIMPGAVLEPFSIVREGSIIWSGAHISHHAEIGRFCFLSSSSVISGNSLIGDRTFVGSNATVFDNIQVGQDSIVGAGSVVRQDCDAQSISVSPSSIVTISADPPSVWEEV